MYFVWMRANVLGRTSLWQTKRDGVQANEKRWSTRGLIKDYGNLSLVDAKRIARNLGIQLDVCRLRPRGIVLSAFGGTREGGRARKRRWAQIA